MDAKRSGVPTTTHRGNAVKPTLLAATLFTIIGTMCGPAAADETESDRPSVTPAQKLSAYVTPGIVYIESTWSAKIIDTGDGLLLRDEPFTSVGACTGFVVTPDGYIATAGHCVNPIDEQYDIDTRFEILARGVEYSVENELYGAGVSEDAIIDYAVSNWKLVSPTSDVGDRIKFPALTVNVSWGAEVSGLETSKSQPARLIDRSQFNEGDVALLKVEADGLNALPLADEPTETLTEIASVGYPQKVDLAVDDDFTPSIKTGAVSSNKTVGSGTTSVYEIDAAVAPGMSGGPTVDFDGNVIGVNSFGSGDSESFNFVRPVSLIKEMLGDAGTEATQSPMTRTYVKGLDAYFAGDKAVAVENLTTVAEDQPANGIAADYLKKAKALPDPPPPPEESAATWPWIAGGAVALLLLIGAVLFAVRRRSRRSPVHGPSTPEPGSAVAVDGRQLGSDAPPAPLGQAAPPLQGSEPPPVVTQPAGMPNAASPRAGSPAPVGFGPGPASATAGKEAPPIAEAPASEVVAAVPGGSQRERMAVPSTATPGTTHHFCTECGASLSAGSKFCAECGTRA